MDLCLCTMSLHVFAVCLYSFSLSFIVYGPCVWNKRVYSFIHSYSYSFLITCSFYKPYVVKRISWCWISKFVNDNTNFFTLFQNHFSASVFIVILLRLNAFCSLQNTVVNSPSHRIWLRKPIAPRCVHWCQMFAYDANTIVLLPVAESSPF